MLDSLYSESSIVFFIQYQETRIQYQVSSIFCYMESASNFGESDVRNPISNSFG